MIKMELVLCTLYDDGGDLGTVCLTGPESLDVIRELVLEIILSNGSAEDVEILTPRILEADYVRYEVAE